MVQTTLNTTKAATKKRPKPDSDDEDLASDVESVHDASLLSNTPPSAKKQKTAPAAKKGKGKPLQDIDNESMMMDAAPASKPMKKKDATDQYQKLTQLEHIIKRPDTYIGSVESTTEKMWVYNSEKEQMEFRPVTFVPGLYKIFDEILVNAADQKQRDPNMKHIKVFVDREKGEISVENDGRGIPVEMHKVSSVYQVAWMMC